MEEKMIRTSKQLDIIAAVVEKVLIGGVVLAAVFAVLVAIAAASGSDAFLKMSSSIDLGHVTLTLADNSWVSGFYMFALCQDLIALVLLFASRYAVKLLRNIFMPMKEGRPFETQCSVNLKKLSFLVLVVGCVWEIGKNITSYFVIQSIQPEDLFVLENLNEISWNYTFHIGFVLVFAVLYLLSFVFKYGEALQKESDETL